MIGALKGTVLLKTTESLILMVGGVGYTVFLPERNLNEIKKDAPLIVFTYTHVREDILQLFGFTTLEEHELFKLLIGVSGIGPKTALHILNRGVDAIKKAIINADVSFFTSIPRLGTKNAQKVIIELKTKLGSTKELDLQSDESGETKELIDSLMGIGFTRQEALHVIRQIPAEARTLKEKIKYSLKLLGKKL